MGNRFLCRESYIRSLAGSRSKSETNSYRWLKICREIYNALLDQRKEVWKKEKRRNHDF
ncbi:MAG: helix-turn-helix domain-containing protein [Firmicutes bacterium]|nr:helix-turn-helix domain-containing protein [Bacillota bacterium]